LAQTRQATGLDSEEPRIEYLSARTVRKLQVCWIAAYRKFKTETDLY